MFFPNGTWQREFTKCGFTRIGRKWGCRTLTTYDHYSITHYPGVIGEDSPHTIITSKDLCGNKTCVHGQRERLSQLDIKDIELLYQCGKTSKSLDYAYQVILQNGEVMSILYFLHIQLIL